MDNFACYIVEEKIEIPQIFDISLRSSVKDGFLTKCLAFLGSLFSAVRGDFDIWYTAFADSVSKKGHMCRALAKPFSRTAFDHASVCFLCIHFSLVICFKQPQVFELQVPL